MTVSSTDLQQLPTLFQTLEVSLCRHLWKTSRISCLKRVFQSLWLDRSQDAVRAELFKEERRSFGHGFECRILPGLHAKFIRSTSFVAKLFPDAIEANQIHRREHQCGFTLQVAGGTFHLMEHQWQRPIGSNPMVEEQVGGPCDQVFHLPASNADEIIFHQKQKEGFFTE